MKKLIFDLDGTLIDSKQRLYSLFSELVPSSILTFNQYWEIKQSGISHSNLLKNKFNYQNSQIENFSKLWMQLIESDKYLELDNPFDFSKDTLLNFKEKGFDLILLTARQFPDKVDEQINNFGWDKYFCNILVSKQIETKNEILTRTGLFKEAFFMVGDTGYDVKTANDLNIFSIGVLSGFHSKFTLQKYNPNEIIPDISFLKKLKILKNI